MCVFAQLVDRTFLDFVPVRRASAEADEIGFVFLNVAKKLVFITPSKLMITPIT